MPAAHDSHRVLSVPQPYADFVAAGEAATVPADLGLTAAVPGDLVWLHATADIDLDASFPADAWSAIDQLHGGLDVYFTGRTDTVIAKVRIVDVHDPDHCLARTGGHHRHSLSGQNVPTSAWCAPHLNGDADHVTVELVAVLGQPTPTPTAGG